MDLTVSLAVVAALVLGGVGLQAWWSARRSRPRQGPPPGEVQAPFVASGRQEPLLGDVSTADEAQGAQGEEDSAGGSAAPCTRIVPPPGQGKPIASGHSPLQAPHLSC